MEKKIIDIFNGGNYGALADELHQTTETELITMLQRQLRRATKESMDLIRAIFAGSPNDDVENNRRRMHPYRQSILFLKTNDMESKILSELIGLLLLEIDSLTSTDLAELAGVYIETIKEGVESNSKSLELLPKILSCINTRDVVSYGGCTQKGTEYKSHVLNTLCSGRWDPRLVIHLATMFKDVPMSDEELRFVISKVLKMFKDMDLQELPPLVYQLLLLSSKGHKKLVLEGVTSYFVQQDQNQKRNVEREGTDDLFEADEISDQLQFIEGTIILHITFAIKQDQELGREFIKYLKAGQSSSMRKTLAPFNVALALSIARIHRFEDQIFDFFKTTVLKSFKDNEKQQESAWVRSVVTDPCDVESLLLDTVKNSAAGWDHVTQGLVQLGFTLMDSFGPKASFGKITDALPSTKLSPTQKACRLGMDILFGTFKVHDVVRAEILQQILNRVVTRATTPVTHFLDLLAKTVRSAPQILLDSLPKVREAFDYLSYLPPPTAEGLLKAIQPLLKISMSLKDSLILVLRKSMYSKQNEARKIAVSGFLMILKNFKVLGPVMSSQASQSSASFTLSQVQVDVHVPHNPNSNEALCLEILCNLRRCLSQQEDVRFTLYEGLTDVVSANVQLGVPILVVLMDQFNKYYVIQEDFVPPIQLDGCAYTEGEETHAAEPMAHLLSCIIRCLLKVLDSRRGRRDGMMDEEEDDEDVPTEVQKALESLTQRMKQCTPEDFHLDKNANFSMSTTVGVKNSINAKLVNDTYEALMEYRFTISDDLSEEDCEAVCELFRLGQTYSDLLKDKQSNTKKGKNSASMGNRGSLLSFKFLTSILNTIYCDNLPQHQSSLDILRDNLALQKFLVTTLLQKCQQIQSTGKCDGPDGSNPDKIFKLCCKAARTLVKHYTEETGSRDENRKERERQISLLCIETLVVILNIVTKRHSDKIWEYIVYIEQGKDMGSCVNTSSEELNTLLFKHIVKFRRLIGHMVEADDADPSPKEVVFMLNLIGALSQHLPPACDQFKDYSAWLVKLAEKSPIDDTGVTKVLLGLLFSSAGQDESEPVAKKSTGCADICLAVARDIHSRLGDIDQETEVDADIRFGTITVRTASPTCLTLVVSRIERELDDIVWVIGMVKAQLAVELCHDCEGQVDATQSEPEKTISARLGTFINVLHELLQSTVPTSHVDAVFKVTTHMYNTLSTYVKFNLWKRQQKVDGLSPRFEKLVKLSGSNMTTCVYPLITYVQNSQTEVLQLASEKGKKKAKDAAAALGKNMIMKESKMVPNLIFAIEQYEKYLIQLSKKTKIDLMDHFKMSTSRDFRINAVILTDALKDMEQSSDTHDESDNEGPTTQQENEEPNAKRQRLSDEPKGAQRRMGLSRKGPSKAL